jgi:hypothetical protein
MILQIFATLSFCLLMLPSAQAEEVVQHAQTVQFTPPAGWRSIDAAQLPRNVKAMVVGQGSTDFPPTMNLGIEAFTGSLEDYLKIVKKINDSQNASWKNLGEIETEAGTASLSQVELTRNYGKVRLVHAILVKDGFAYILNGAASASEFTSYYPEFLKAMRSLRLTTLEPVTESSDNGVPDAKTQ